MPHIGRLDWTKSQAYSQSVVENLKRIRLERGLSQNQLAKRAGIVRSTLSMLEAGQRNPSLALCHSLADALEVSLAEVLAQVEHGQPDSAVGAAGRPLGRRPGKASKTK